MLLEPERPDRCSRAVRTRLIETDRLLHLLKILHGKATGYERRQLKLRPALEVT